MLSLANVRGGLAPDPIQFRSRAQEYIELAQISSGNWMPASPISCRRRGSMTWVVALALVLGSSAGCHHPQSRAKAAHPIDFNQDVQPILASRCFSCHGPDPEMRKAGLRLDLAEAAMKKRQGHPDAIVPGHPEKSELIHRIESTDSHYLMPQTPQGEAKPMKPEEIAILRQWIQGGAAYRPWSFELAGLTGRSAALLAWNRDNTPAAAAFSGPMERRND